MSAVQSERVAAGRLESIHLPEARVAIGGQSFRRQLFEESAHAERPVPVPPLLLGREVDLGLLLMHLEVGEGRAPRSSVTSSARSNGCCRARSAASPRLVRRSSSKLQRSSSVPPGRHGNDTARPEHPLELGGRTRRVGKEEQRKGSREYVEPGIGELQMLGVHDPQVDVGDSRRMEVAPASSIMVGETSIPVRRPIPRAAAATRTAPRPQATSSRRASPGGAARSSSRSAKCAWYASPMRS